MESLSVFILNRTLFRYNRKERRITIILNKITSSQTFTLQVHYLSSSPYVSKYFFRMKTPLTNVLSSPPLVITLRFIDGLKKSLVEFQDSLINDKI